MCSDAETFPPCRYKSKDRCDYVVVAFAPSMSVSVHRNPHEGGSVVTEEGKARKRVIPLPRMINKSGSTRCERDGVVTRHLLFRPRLACPLHPANWSHLPPVGAHP